MATGNNAANCDNTRQQNASDDADTRTVITYKCAPCKDGGTIKEACSYCPECNEYYCDQCLPSHITLRKLHTVYRKSDADKWGQRLPRQQLMEKCTKHPTETINIICHSHNELCCPVCISLDHNTCDRKGYIPTEAIGVRRSEKFQNVKGLLKRYCETALQYKAINENFLQEQDSKNIYSFNK